MKKTIFPLLLLVAVAATVYLTMQRPAQDAAPATAPAPTPAPAVPVVVPETTTVVAAPTADGAAGDDAEAVVEEPAIEAVAAVVEAPAIEAAAIEAVAVEAAAVVEAAQAYIETITQSVAAPISVRDADHFVTPEQLLVLTSQPVPAGSATAAGVATAEAGVRQAVPAIQGGTDVAAGTATAVPAVTPEAMALVRTVVDLVELEGQVSPGSLFYVRTVRESDVHGVWGIVQEGLINNFAHGVLLRDGEKSATYRVQIPHDADELLADRSSSYLGRLIYHKTRESYVFNFKQNRMGRNPDRVRPGQEIVIINFSNAELIEIYRRFSADGVLAAAPGSS